LNHDVPSYKVSDIFGITEMLVYRRFAPYVSNIFIHDNLVDWVYSLIELINLNDLNPSNLINQSTIQLLTE